MAYEIRDNTFSLFKNDRKETDNHPDYTGNGRIGGVDMWVSAWIKEDRNGKKFMSCSMKPKDGAQQGTTAKKPSQSTADFIDDDVPF